MTNRDSNGRFLPGQSGNPKGRNPREVERAYLELFRGEVDPETFRKTVKAVLDSAQKGNAQSQRLLLEYLLGKPNQPLTLTVEVFTALEGLQVAIEDAHDLPGGKDLTLIKCLESMRSTLEHIRETSNGNGADNHD